MEIRQSNFTFSQAHLSEWHNIKNKWVNDWGAWVVNSLLLRIDFLPFIPSCRHFPTHTFAGELGMKWIYEGCLSADGTLPQKEFEINLSCLTRYWQSGSGWRWWWSWWLAWRCGKWLDILSLFFFFTFMDWMNMDGLSNYWWRTDVHWQE